MADLRIEPEILTQLKKARPTAFAHPAFEIIHPLGREASGLRGDMLVNLFVFFIIRKNEWIHWTDIRDTTFWEANRHCDNGTVCDTGNSLLAFLKDKTFERWKVELTSKTGGHSHKSKMWRLIVVDKNEDSANHTSHAPSQASNLFLPEFEWKTKDQERRIPLWLPFDPKSKLNFFVEMSTRWSSPRGLSNYEALKKRKWRARLPQKTNDDVDTSLCAFKDFRVLDKSESVLSLRIEASSARLSDYLVTNAQLVEWSEKREYDLERQLRAELDSPHEMKKFLHGAVNPISVVVTLVTEDHKLILIKNDDYNRWDTPAGEFIDPTQDIQRMSPYGISPQETVIRVVHKDLGVAVHCQPIRWNALAIQRRFGGAALIGEMNIGLPSSEVRSIFSNRRLRKLPSIEFVELSPKAIFKVYNDTKTWPIPFFEAAIACSLFQRFPEEVVVNSLVNSEPKG